MQFIGPPFTFGVNLINENSGLIGPKAAVTGPSGVYWMGYDNFYVYTGSVKKIPCSVLSYVFDDFNSSQAFKVAAFTNTEYDEVGWFYCSADVTVIDKYVTYNYEENVWMIGELSRTAWLDEGVFANPKATSSNYLYNHELGNDNDGVAMTNVFIESSDFDLGEGEEFQFISKIIPDVTFNGTGDTGATGQKVDLVLKKRNFPGESLTTGVTGACTSTTTKIDTRVRGRQAALRVQSDDTDTTVLGVGFRLGATRIETQPDGKR